MKKAHPGFISGVVSKNLSQHSWVTDVQTSCFVKCNQCMALIKDLQEQLLSGEVLLQKLWSSRVTTQATPKIGLFITAKFHKVQSNDLKTKNIKHRPVLMHGVTETPDTIHCKDALEPEVLEARYYKNIMLPFWSYFDSMESPAQERNGDTTF